MGLMLDALKQIEAKTPVPVIVPLPDLAASWDEDRKLQDWLSGSQDGHSERSGHSQRNGHSVRSEESRRASQILRCAQDDTGSRGDMLAQVAMCARRKETSTEVSASFSPQPAIVWPRREDCDNERFYADTAAAILRQLTSGADVREHFAVHPTVLAFTSPMDGDGKTGAVISLAPHFATMLGDVLAIDAHPRFDMSARLGITADDDPTAPLQIYSTDCPHLSVAPGSASWDPCWTDDLRGAWPLTLVDAASLQHAEGSAMAQCCDAVYMVVRLGHTPRRAVRDAARRLRTSEAKLRGCVVVR